MPRPPDLVVEVVAGGKLVAVAEDRGEAFRQDSIGRHPALERTRHAERLKLRWSQSAYSFPYGCSSKTHNNACWKRGHAVRPRPMGARSRNRACLVIAPPPAGTFNPVNTE